VLSQVEIENFRCIERATLDFDPRGTGIIGQNASGKTSLLEALFVLGRGTSFRAARPEVAIRHGASLLRVVGQLAAGGPAVRVGVEVVAGSGTTIRLDGSAGTRADLAAAVPCQVLDPASHELVQGPPGERRAFLDWGTFHVEQNFLPHWQRYRRALQQRNAALRAGDGGAAWAWDESLAAAGEVVDQCRRRALESLAQAAGSQAEALLGDAIELQYLSGWAEGQTLAEALEQSHHRDLSLGSTQVGPHRADFRIQLRERRVRETVSRGQEKLVAASLTLAQVALVQSRLGRAVMLLVDEPGADLDRTHLRRFQESLHRSPAQVWATALRPDVLELPAEGRGFHVERGTVAPLL
jgi:DNA replication and repair protein RecF